MPPQGIKSKRIGRGKLVRLCILAFSWHISRTQSFKENLFAYCVGTRLEKETNHLKPLVSPIGCLVACSGRISVDTHTHTHTHKDRQTNYCNPRCACVPRVNYSWSIASSILQHFSLSRTNFAIPSNKGVNNFAFFVGTRLAKETKNYT